MIDRIDAFLTGLYYRPIYLVIAALIPTLIGFALYTVAPHIDHESAFFLPVLGVHRWGVGFAIAGLTVGLVFYAQHASIGRSLALFVVVFALVMAAFSLVNQDPFERVRHFESQRVGGNVYHLGGVNDISEEGYIIISYTVYRCDFLGLFCDQIGRDIVPQITAGGLFQNAALFVIEDDFLRVLDGGTARVLFEYGL